MKKIKKTIEINKYSISLNPSPWEFMEDARFGGGNGDSEMLLGFFNTNFTGARNFKKNFLNFPEIAYESVEQIKKQAKELKMDHWVVVSFYRENGYDGVYTRTGDDALRIKCNNWVNFGKEGFYYVIFAKEQKEIGLFQELLEQWLNEGSYVYEIYDEEEGNYIEEEQFWTLIENRDNFQKWKEKMIEKYGFKESDFNISPSY